MKMALIAALVAVGVIGVVAAHPWDSGVFGGMGHGNGPFGNGTGNNTNATLEAFRTAVTNGDYATAKQLSAQYGFAQKWMSVLDEESFKLFSRIQNDLQPKNAAEAQTLMAQLKTKLGDKFPQVMGGMGMMRSKSGAWAKGFEQGFGRGMGKGMRMGRGMMGNDGDEDDAPSAAATTPTAG